jgi:ribose 5-phosphate isomerase B
MARTVITAETIRSLVAKGEKRMDVLPGDIVTPLAAELSAAHGIQVSRPLPATPGQPVAKAVPGPEGFGAARPGHEGPVAFGSDHAGYQLKEQLKKYAEELGYRTIDMGTTTEEPCDYPDFAYAVARSVSQGEAWRGVIVDGVGVGSCAAANKIRGIRAVCCHNELVARSSREHNDANVLTLGSRVLGSEVSKSILKTWLETWFAGGRHKKRVDKIAELENRFMK